MTLTDQATPASTVDRAALRRRIVNAVRGDTVLSQHAGAFAHAADIAELFMPFAEELIAEGRRQANNAIDWNTTCVGCADRLDRSYADFAAGGADTARRIFDDVQALQAATGAQALSGAAAIASNYAGNRAESHAEPRFSLGGPPGNPQPSGDVNDAETRGVRFP